jgi:hypothetical protein
MAEKEGINSPCPYQTRRCGHLMKHEKIVFSPLRFLKRLYALFPTQPPVVGSAFSIEVFF